jgi:hypothetical protein
VFAIKLVGFGLLLGALCRTVAQLNNWSSIPLLLLLMPVFFASLALPSIVRAILDALPSVQAVKLLIDSLSAKSGQLADLVHDHGRVGGGGIRSPDPLVGAARSLRANSPSWPRAR